LLGFRWLQTGFDDDGCHTHSTQHTAQAIATHNTAHSTTTQHIHTYHNMEKLDLSTHAKDIKQHYDAVVSGEHAYAIFTTLKDSSLKPTVLSDGDIKDFVSEFEEGSVQFGVIRVNPIGSDVHKIVLLGWCPDSAPIKSKVSYASNLSNVGKILHYHVEVTARDSDDLDVDDIMKTVSNASGARYSIQSVSPASSASSASKFKPTPKPASKASIYAPAPIAKPAPSFTKPKPTPPKKESSNDGWGDEEEIKERDFSKEPLQNVPSAYKPTKVDIDALRKETPKSPQSSNANATATISLNPSGGLTSLPKPKPSHSVLSRYKQDEVVKPEFGTKTPVFDSTPSRGESKVVGGLSRNFGASNGKTPAQLWAEKKGQYKEVEGDNTPVNAADIEKEIDHNDIGVNSAKAKFEKLHLEAEKEQQQEEEESKPRAVFPPPPAREESKSFPPPPAREESKSFPPPGNSGISKFQEEEEAEDDDDGWGEEEKKDEPAPAPPARSLPPAPVAERSLPPAPTPTPAAAPTPAPAPASNSTKPSAVAEYEYEKDEDNEIGFAEGEIIIDIEFVDDDWWQGTNKAGESGLFPASYVSLKKGGDDEETEADAAPAPTLPTRSEPAPAPAAEGPSYVAEFDYDATEENELSFKEGDVITNVDKIEEDWWLGTINGERKLFPANYVSPQ
jgi:hypothetical protein